MAEAALLLSTAAYLGGSVNFSILLFLLLGKDDPRAGFSGNPGVANVFRQAGLGWALVVLLLDLGRSALFAALSLCFLTVEHLPVIGLALILGNLYPCFHGFSGGKGVANYLGFSVVWLPAAATASLAAWVLGFSVSKKPFIGSFAMVAVLAAAGIIRCRSNPWAICAVTVSVALIGYAHRKNMENWMRR